MQAHLEQDFTKRLDAGLWRRVLGYVKPFHPHLAAIIALMIVCAAMDVVFPLLTREAIDRFVAGATTEGLGGFIARYGIAVAVQTASIAGFIFLCGRVEAGVCHRIRRLGFQRLQELSFSYYDRTPIGYILSRMTSDTQRLGDTIGWSLIDLVWGTGFIVLSVAVMLSINVTLSLALIVVLPVIAALAVYFQKRILASYREVRKTNSRITGALNEGIAGAKTTKTLVREVREHPRVRGTDRKKCAPARAGGGAFGPFHATGDVAGLRGRRLRAVARRVRGVQRDHQPGHADAFHELLGADL
jgi:ATP-binding cassette subfamily B protein